MRGRAASDQKKHPFSNLTDRLYDLKLRLDEARAAGMKFYTEKRYGRAEKKLEEAKGLADALSARWTVGPAYMAPIENHLRLCSKHLEEARQPPGDRDARERAAGHDALVREVFYRIYDAAKRYGRNDVLINVNSDVRSRLPKGLQGRAKRIYSILREAKLPLEQDETWPHIFHGRKSDLTRYGRTHGLL